MSVTRELVASWRREADRLLEQAAAARGDGDPLYAEELEACAVDYQTVLAIVVLAIVELYLTLRNH